MVEGIPYRSIPWFPKLFVDYMEERPSTSELYEHPPSIDGIKSSKKKKKFSKENREVLVDVLLEQHRFIRGFNDSLVSKNIHRLTSDSYTITTGQQLHPFLGPIMVANKIEETIRLSKELDLVPVFWMASEDHDFEEVKQVTVFGKTYEWQNNEGGAVGRMTTEGIVAIANQVIRDFTKDERVVRLFTTLRNIYSEHNNVADATRALIFEWFGSDGLVCIDGDHPKLKELFRSQVTEEFKENHAYHGIKETNAILKNKGYKAVLNPQKQNFFVVTDNQRIKLDIEEQKATSIHQLSPNVALRPLYQEVVLPNVAYVAGPTELCYWLQLKNLFVRHHVNYPVIMPRKFSLELTEKDQKYIDKQGLHLASFFQNKDDFRRTFLQSKLGSSSKSIEIVLLENQKILEVCKNIGKQAYLAAKIYTDICKAELNKLEDSLLQNEAISSTFTKLLKIKEKYFQISLERTKFIVEKKVNN